MDERAVVVADIMRRRIVGTRAVGDLDTFLPPEDTQVSCGASVRVAASVMLAELVDALPVVDDRGRVVGVVTWADIVAHVAILPPDPRP